MSQFHTDPCLASTQAPDAHACYLTGENWFDPLDCPRPQRGWYWWIGPRLNHGKPNGPYPTESDAIADARSG